MVFCSGYILHLACAGCTLRFCKRCSLGLLSVIIWSSANNNILRYTEGPNYTPRVDLSSHFLIRSLLNKAGDIFKPSPRFMKIFVVKSFPMYLHISCSVFIRWLDVYAWGTIVSLPWDCSNTGNCPLIISFSHIYCTAYLSENMYCWENNYFQLSRTRLSSVCLSLKRVRVYLCFPVGGKIHLFIAGTHILTLLLWILLFHVLENTDMGFKLTPIEESARL